MTVPPPAQQNPGPHPGPHSASSPPPSPAPATGARRPHGARSVLAAAALLLLASPLAAVVPTLFAAFGIVGHSVSSAVQFMAQVLQIMLLATLLRWLRLSREGERPALLPLVALGVVIALHLLVIVTGAARIVVFSLSTDVDIIGIEAVLVMLSTLWTALGALVVMGLAFVALVRRGHAPRTVRVPLSLRTLVLVLLSLVVLHGLAMVSMDGGTFLALQGGGLPTGVYVALMLLSGVLICALVMVSALVIVRTEARAHLLAWSVPVTMWCGGLLTSAVSHVTATFLSDPDSVLTIRRTEAAARTAIDLPVAGVMLAAASALLVLALGRRADVPSTDD